FLRSGEGDEADAWMLDERVAHLRAAAAQEIDDTRRHARFLQEREEAPGNPRRVRGWLENDGVAGNGRRAGHPRHDGQRKVPGRNDRAGAEWNVEEIVVFRVDPRDRLVAGIPIGLARIEIEE